MRPTGLRTEDLLLAAWNAVGVPLVAVSVLGPVLTLGDEPDPVAGLVQLLAVLGAIVAVATRPTGSIRGAEPLGTDARLAFYGPLVGGWPSSRARRRRTSASGSTGSSSGPRS